MKAFLIFVNYSFQVMKVQTACLAQLVFNILSKNIFFHLWNFHPKLTSVNFNLPLSSKSLKVQVQSCKLCDSRYMITSTQINMAVLVFKLLSRTVLFINRKHNRNCQKVVLFTEMPNLTGK